jgi:hypothetical protein
MDNCSHEYNILPISSGISLPKKNFNSLREWIINYFFVGRRHSEVACQKMREAWLKKDQAARDKVFEYSHVGYEVAEVVKYIYFLF